MEGMMRLGALALTAWLVAGSALADTLVTGQARPAISPESVQIYLEPPAEYEVIGAVSATSGLGFTGQHNLDRATARVRREAAEIGANGIIIDYMGVPGGQSPMAGASVGGVLVLSPTRDGGDREIRGRAVFVPDRELTAPEPALDSSP